MISVYYQVTFFLAEILTGIYLFVLKKNFNTYITLIFVLVPVVNLGNMLLSQAETEEAALNAVKISSMGGCFLQLFFMLAVFSLCPHANRHRRRRHR